MLGAAWRRDCGVGPGDPVSVVVRPEGPQRDDLAPDPWLSTTAGHTSDGLTGPSAGPDVRAQRIAEMVGLLKLGITERPPV